LRRESIGPDAQRRCALPTITRTATAQVQIHSTFNQKQQAFYNFVQTHNVTKGVSEPDQKKLTPLLKLKYHDPILDAIPDLGKVFAGFQKYFYQGGA
jgi:type I restriction enzyme, R subunit